MATTSLMARFTAPVGPPSRTTAFNTLPIELNKAIVLHLSSDRDIATYRHICRVTSDAVDADWGSFWRARFRATYDMDGTTPNKELRRVYQRRARVLRRSMGMGFFRGYRQREMDAVVVLRSMVVEAWQGTVEIDELGRPWSRNHAALIEFIQKSKFLLNDRRPPPPSAREKNEVHPMLAAVKLMCLPFLLQLKGVKAHVFGVEEVQRAVYAASNAAPMYTGPERSTLNMQWALQCMSFFRHHMMDEAAATLFDAMSELPLCQRPTAWRDPLPLTTGVYPLSRHWKGTYAYLSPDEIVRLRKLNDDDTGDAAYFTDLNVDEGKIQSMEMKFLGEGQLPWPRVFEKHLDSLRGAAPLKTQGRSKPQEAQGSIQFVGTGTDLDDDFRSMGWLNALPPQQGIPGWQRITFMKHFMDGDLSDWEEDNLWAYEGVVLPGGRIILGRWWFASPNVDLNCDYNGPFIFWAVEPDRVDQTGESEE